MLEIEIPNFELYDDSRNLFIPVKGRKLSLEHSLVSLSKWESIWNVPLLTELDSSKGLSGEKLISYIKCMTIGKMNDETVYSGLTDFIIRQINRYIEAPMSATTFNNNARVPGRPEVLTSEVIYYRMIMYGIPFECEKWHLNRLITLIRVCSVKNSPGKKLSKAETAQRFYELNEARKKKLNTKG